MVMLDSLEVAQTMKGMYRYVTTMPGAQYVIIIGDVLILMWSVDSLDSNHMVYICILECLYSSLNEGSQYYRYNYFEVSNSPPYLYGLFYCSGSEQSLLSCSRSSYSSLLYCSSSEIAGVRCVGK